MVRKAIRLIAGVVAGLAMMGSGLQVASAGETQVHKFNVRSGEFIANWAQGDLNHAPHRLVLDSELYAIDICGNAYSATEDIFGKRQLAKVVDASSGLGELKVYAANKFSRYGIDRQGQLYTIILNERLRKREGPQFKVLRTIHEGHHFADVSHLISSDTSNTPLMLTTGGHLQVIELSGKRVRLIRRLKAEWGKTVSAVTATVGNSPSNYGPVLFTLNASGELFKTRIMKTSGETYAAERQRLGDKTYADTVALLGVTRAPRKETLYRVTSTGDLFGLDLQSGLDMQVGSKGQFSGSAWFMKGGDLYILAGQPAAQYAACPTS